MSNKVRSTLMPSLREIGLMALQLVVAALIFLGGGISYAISQWQQRHELSKLGQPQQRPIPQGRRRP